MLLFSYPSRSEFKQNITCKHLPPIELDQSSAAADDNTVSSSFEPLCNCDEFRRTGGSCRHIPPWLSPATTRQSDVQLYAPRRKRQRVGPVSSADARLPAAGVVNAAATHVVPQQEGGAVSAATSSLSILPTSDPPLSLTPPPALEPLPFPGYPFCTCAEFKSTGACKHLPPPEASESQLDGPAFRPLCTCAEWKRNNSCKHMPRGAAAAASAATLELGMLDGPYFDDSELNQALSLDGAEFWPSPPSPSSLHMSTDDIEPVQPPQVGSSVRSVPAATAVAAAAAAAAAAVAGASSAAPVQHEQQHQQRPQASQSAQLMSQLHAFGDASLYGGFSPTAAPPLPSPAAVKVPIESSPTKRKAPGGKGGAAAAAKKGTVDAKKLSKRARNNQAATKYRKKRKAEFQAMVEANQKLKQQVRAAFVDCTLQPIDPSPLQPMRRRIQLEKQNLLMSNMQTEIKMLRDQVKYLQNLLSTFRMPSLPSLFSSGASSLIDALPPELKRANSGTSSLQ